MQDVWAGRKGRGLLRLWKRKKTGRPEVKRCAVHILVLIGILLLCVDLSPASAREVRVGFYENQPKVFTGPDGRPSGIFVDIIEEIARREGWSLKYVHGVWSQCLARLDSGEIDLMVDVAYSRERAEKYDFCSDDVICNWAQVYTRKGLRIELITDLDGMRVATLRQGIHLTRLRNLAEGFGFRFDLTLVEDYDSVFRLLDRGEVDAGVVNRIFGYAHEDQYNVIRSPVVFSPASLRFAVKKGANGDVIAAVDRHLAAMKKEKGSAYHQTLRRWLGETSRLNLPRWIVWTLGAAVGGVLLLLVMSGLLKRQVNRKTAHLRLANENLEKQVNETMKAQRELKRSEERLIQQERLSAIGQMASGIAHDFNNMLIPILGYSDLLLENRELLEDRERVLSMLESIRNSAQTSRETVKRLQQFYRADSSPRMEEVKIADLVSEVVAATRPLWKSDREAYSVRVRIREEVSPDIVVTVSRGQFSEALMNLVLNALHAVSSGGEVTIRAAVEDENLHLEIRDTGIGMSSDVARKCLEPFFSTKGEEGTGMGLAMVHGIVKRHNGSLTIDSAPGEGTSIHVRIPLVQEDAVDQPVNEAVSRVGESLKILVVDDEKNSRDLLSEYLALDGHRVTTAEDPVQGMAEFDRGAFDLVITDWSMPKISGDAMARHVKASDRPVPVLMISGFAQIRVSQGDNPGGVDEILENPIPWMS